MSLTDSGRFAILGLLSFGAMSGYDLRRLVTISIGHFWSESYGQIYPALHTLSAEGLIRPVDRSSQQGGRKRQEYAITDQGLSALDEWLKLPPRVQPPRNELLLKLFLGSRAPAQLYERHLLEHRKKAEEELLEYANTEQELKRGQAENPNLPFWLMTLRYGQLTAEAQLRWADESLAVLRARSEFERDKKGSQCYTQTGQLR